MSKPEWQTWPEEPWRATGAFSLLDVEAEGTLGRHMPMRDRNAGIRRAVECVNALAGIRNPAAVREVVEAATELSIVCDLDASGIKSPGPRERIKARVVNLDEALAALDQPPEET